jgi:arylsulfatase
MSIGMRHIPMAVPVIGSAGWHMKQLIRCPTQFKIGFFSNNPPVYDLLPKAKEAIENFELGKRPAPE